MPLEKYMQTHTQNALAEEVSSVMKVLSVKRDATALTQEREREQHASPVAQISSEALKTAQEGDLMISKIS